MPKTLPMKSLLDFERFFEEAQQRGASDVHLQSGVVPMMRINGILVPAEDAKVLSAKEVQAIITAGLTKDQLARFENDLELDTAFALKNGMRLRLNIYKEKNMPALSARLIPAEIPDMEWINAQDTLYAFAELTQGLVLVTGPTGHGKSTTVAAMLEHINQNRKENIITLEDPMEFLYQPKESIISQRELGLDMKSFASGIKHVLRQDPNVVLVGEMRDLETIAATITLAETGHLVFATLHTNSAWQTIDYASATADSFTAFFNLTRRDFTDSSSEKRLQPHRRTRNHAEYACNFQSHPRRKNGTNAELRFNKQSFRYAKS